MYENIENIGKCDLGKRFVKSQGLIETPNLVMKLYSMLPKEISIDIDSAKDFIISEINKEEIKPYLSGMGFTIIGNKILNASVWGAGFPILTKNEIYSFKKDDLSDAIKADLNYEGAYCGFEFIISEYESLLWIKYLKSDKAENDKKNYINSFLETILE